MKGVWRDACTGDLKLDYNINMSDIPAIEPIDLQAELEGNDPPQLLDVRDDSELGISNLPKSINIPLDDLADRMREIDPMANWVVYCRTGNRSAKATEYLIAHGFTQVRNLATGINGWANTVDSSMLTY